MFDLAKKTCRLTNVNARHEKHDDENVLAADMEFKAEFSNDVLAEFASALRASFYEKDTLADLADQAADRPTKLRFTSLLQPIKWDAEIIGAALTIDHGLSPLAFDLADISKFRIECHEGGMVAIMFRAQVHPSEAELAKLFMCLDTNVDLTIEPPEVRAE